MNEKDLRFFSDQYRGYVFLIETRREPDGLWVSQYCLLALPDVKRAVESRYHWVSLDPRWATPAEAERSAVEGAFAAIDALSASGPSEAAIDTMSARARRHATKE